MAISINITVGENAGSTTVQAIGEDTGPVEAGEIANLNLSDPAGLIAAYLGAFPTTVFFSDPCNDGQPWYGEFGWDPVTVTRRATGATIKSITTTPYVASTQSCVNTTNETMEFTPSLSQHVTNTVSSTSSESQAVSVSQEISYEIGFLGTGASGATSISYSKTWENSYTKSTDEGFSLNLGAAIPVPPGETMVAELMLSRGTVVIEIGYLLSLSGRIAAGYYHEFRGHHIFGVPVDWLLTNAKFPTTVTATETLTIDFYANASIVVRNGAQQIVHVHAPDLIAEAVLPVSPQDAPKAMADA
jgi:hypothetical protein